MILDGIAIPIYRRLPMLTSQAPTTTHYVGSRTQESVFRSTSSPNAARGPMPGVVMLSRGPCASIQPALVLPICQAKEGLQPPPAGL